LSGPASKSITAASPKKKLAKRKKPNHSIWKLLKYHGKELPKGPVFEPLLRQMLTWPKSRFLKTSRFISSPSTPMSHFICARLLIEAAQGDLGSIREVLDRIEGRPGSEQKINVTHDGKPQPMVIQLVYEAPSAAMIEGQRRIDERNKSRSEKMLDSIKQLPEKSEAGIEYIETEPGSAG
jgi:hypothetical protein